MAQNSTIHAEVLLLFVLILTSICFTLSSHLQCAVLRMGWRGGCFSVRWRLLQRFLRSCGLLQIENTVQNQPALSEVTLVCHH